MRQLAPPKSKRSSATPSKLLGDATKAKNVLGWTAKTDFATLVKEMMRADMESAQRDALMSKHGYAAPERHE